MIVTVFDVETSGVDVFKDRILTCHVAKYEMTSDKFDLLESYDWIINPGIEVPTEASDINGLTTEFIQENGRSDWQEAIQEIWDEVLGSSSDVVAAYNLPFDLTFLGSESVRCGQLPGDYLDTVGLTDAYEPEDIPVFVDALVWDKANDKYRRGSRKLVDVARHHGIQVDDDKLHDASYDVHITAQLTYKFLDEWFGSGCSKEQLKSLMRREKKSQAQSLQEYFRKTDPEAVVDGGFPVYSNANAEWRNL